MLALSTRSLPPRGSIEELCREAAQLQFRGLAVSSHDVAPRPGDLGGAAAKTGVQIVCIKSGCLEARTGPRRIAEELASLDEGRRARAVKSAFDHVAFARAIYCKTIVLCGAFAEGPGLDERVRHLEGRVDRGEAGGEALEEIRILTNRNRERHLEQYCRSLHAITRAHADAYFAIPPAGRPHELLNAAGLDDVLADVKSSNLDLWFDIGRARASERLGCEASVDLLSKFASKMAGCDLHDARGIREHLVPGEGEVDWIMVRDHLRRAAVRVLDLDVGAGPGSIREAARAVESLGVDH
ncbi:MAG: hypothetical protein HY286_01310 [Planctomycetes bacterium]|nr:hypothetical protein [Planctomycetota bacterium]